MAPKKLADIPYSCIHGLSRILDASSNNQENWHALAERIDIYKAVDIASFERKSLQLDGSPCQSMLNDWAMTGANVDELFTLLYKIQNTEAFLFLKNSGLVSKSLANSLKLKSQVKHHPIQQLPNQHQSLNPNDARSIMHLIDASNSSHLAVNETPKDMISLSNVAERKDSLTDDYILHSLRTKGLIEFSYNEVLLATNNFDDSKLTNGGCKLGMGSFGTVYKGKLKNTTFAIKKMNLQDNMSARSLGLSQFAVEVLTLSKYRHPHLLELAGYSLDPKAPCLIYYYMEKGSLAKVLSTSESTQIPWQTRLKISKQIAEGLVYLHTAQDKPLIHRDLKSANILLTNDYQAKIGDFGLARLGSDHKNSIVVTNRLQGTMGYISPEAALGKISTKTDTYSYGVLLLELLTNLQAFDPSRGYEHQTLIGLVENKMSTDSDISKFVSSQGVKWPYVVAEQFLEISQLCFEVHNLRPTTNVLLEKISLLLDNHVSAEHLFDKWIEPGNHILKASKPLCTNKKTILVLTGNKGESNLIQGRISKLLDGESRTSSLRSLKDMEFHFVTLYDAIVIICNPVNDFVKCLHDAINRFNPDLVISSGLCHGVRGRVSLGDLIICKEIPADDVIYKTSDVVHGVMGVVERSVRSSTALWQLPGLLPKPPPLPASRILLWISQLIMELNTDTPRDSSLLKKIGYDHSLSFADNMKLFTEWYPCLKTVANMNILNFDPATGALDTNLDLKVGVSAGNIDLQRQACRPTLHFGPLLPLNIPYQQGMAFDRAKLCPKNILGCDLETLGLYSMCTKSQTPCVSIKSVSGFADPYEDERYSDYAFNMSMMGVAEFIGAFLSPSS